MVSGKAFTLLPFRSLDGAQRNPGPENIASLDYVSLYPELLVEFLQEIT
jgi:hypothetical protein